MILMIHQYQRNWTRLKLSLRALMVILCVFVVFDLMCLEIPNKIILLLFWTRFNFRPGLTLLVHIIYGRCGVVIISLLGDLIYVPYIYILQGAIIERSTNKMMVEVRLEYTFNILNYKVMYVSIKIQGVWQEINVKYLILRVKSRVNF